MFAITVQFNAYPLYQLSLFLLLIALLQAQKKPKLVLRTAERSSNSAKLICP